MGLKSVRLCKSTAAAAFRVFSGFRCFVSARVPSSFWTASSTRRRTGATATATTGASTVKGAVGSGLQVGRRFAFRCLPEVARSSLTPAPPFPRRRIPAERPAPAAHHPRRLLRLRRRLLRPQNQKGHLLRGQGPEEGRSERKEPGSAGWWEGPVANSVSRTHGCSTGRNAGAQTRSDSSSVGNLW